MAKATKKLERKIVTEHIVKMIPITKTVEVEKDVETVTLELTKFEALTLADVLAKVGGAEVTYGTAKATRRKFTATILRALQIAGYDFTTSMGNPELTGRLEFTKPIEEKFPDYKGE